MVTSKVNMSSFRILWTLVLLCISGLLCAQETEKLVIYYRFDKADVDSSYTSNSANLHAIRSLFARSFIVDSISIQVSSSPEGSIRRNAVLANQRAEAVKAMLLSVGSARVGLTEDQIKIKVIPENWEGLLDMVKDQYFRHDREKVIGILMDDKIGDDTREWRLKRLDDGYTWNYLRRKYMPQLRQAVIVRFDYRTLDVARVSMELTSSVVALSASPAIRSRELQHVPPVIPSIPDAEPVSLPVAVKSNLLYDLAMVPNVGVEVGFGKGWTVGADWSYAWWSNDSKHFYWRTYGGELNVRRYFGKAAHKNDFAGHHAGIYGQAYTYDFETGGKGQMSRLTYGGGLEYGYALPLCENLSLDFSLGLGFLTGEYKIYEPDDGCYVWKETRQRYYMGPTKAEISLVWKIGGRKGGGR